MLKKAKPQKKTKRGSDGSTQSQGQQQGSKPPSLSSSGKKKPLNVDGVPVTLDLNTVTTKRVKFETVIKETDDGRSPYTVAVELDKKQYVIKARTGDVDDHVLNTNILRSLSIPGVRAPAAAKITPEFAKDLDAKLRPASDKAPEIRLFLEALNSKVTPGQVSERAPGKTLEKILERVDTGPMLDVVENAGDSEDAIKALLQAIQRPGDWGKNRQDEFDQIKDNVGRTKGKERTKAIKVLKDVLNAPPALKRMEIMNDVHALGWKSAVRKGRQENEALGRAEQRLLSLAAAPDGAYALGALAVADLLCGMDDRIMGKWNGANFMFDTEEGVFWCIDNAKNAELGLSAGNDEKWAAWVAGLKATRQKEQLAELVYDALYAGPPFGGRIDDIDKGTREAAIGKAVTDTLAAAENLVDDQTVPAEVRKRLRDRIATLKAQPDRGPQIVRRERRGAVTEMTDAERMTVAQRKKSRKLKELKNM